MIGKKLFRKALIHRKSGADIIRSRITDAEQIECGLNLAVLSVLSVQSEEHYISHAADGKDIRSETASAPILPHGFNPADIRIALLNPADIFSPVTILFKNVRNIFVASLISQINVQKHRLMPFILQRLVNHPAGA